LRVRVGRVGINEPGREFVIGHGEHDDP
jgi:hypothetical protein